MCEECAEALVAHDASTEIGLCHRADQEAEDERCRRKTQLMIEVADHAKHDDGLYIEDTVVGCIRTDRAEHEDQRHQDVLRNLQDLYEALDTCPLNDQHDEVADHTCSEDTVYDIRVLYEEKRTGGQAVDQETAEHHRGNTVARDTKHEERDHRTTDGCVICTLRCDDTLWITCTEGFRMLAHVLCGDVSEHTRGGTADTRKDTDAGSDDSCSQCARKPGNELLHGEAEALYLRGRDGLYALCIHLLCRLQDICDCEDTDESGQLIEASQKIRITEGKTCCTIDRCHTDEAEHQSKETCEEALDHISCREDRHHRECEEADTEVLNRCELQRNVCKHRCEEGQDKEREQGSEEGEDDTDTQCLHRLALLCHRVTIKGGCDGRSGTRHVEENRGDQSAGDTSDVNRNQGVHTEGGFHAEGQREHQGDGHGCRKTRNRSEDDTDRDTGDHEK